MTMVSSGPISLGGNATTGGLNQSINIELGQSATATISLNDSNVRTLLGVSSGAISLNDAYGKANQFSFTISTNQSQANLRTLAVNAGWNTTSKVVATINSGVEVTSGSTATPALTIDGSFPGGVELTNNGTIVGRGGAGGTGGSYPASGSGTAATAGGGGGTGLSVSVAVTINNASGTIGGGGGGGGGGGANREDYTGTTTSGGGGGGGGGFGTGGSKGAGVTNAFNGNTGGLTSSGSGGLGGFYGGATYDNPNNMKGGTGGNGGSAGSSGSTGGTSVNGAYGNKPTAGAGGGSGGNAVTGNSNITWTNTGTRLGGIT